MSNITVHARPAQELQKGNLPAQIQWMPPGLQTVQPMGIDAPFSMNVTPAIAAEAERQLQQLRRAAAAGKDVEPYGDFNHEDKGRAFKAKRFWWGGSDPKSGGVRLDVEWTGAGARAVLDGELPCVSATWMLNKVTNAFVGIAHNVGGLVPRSAFHAIQVFAKGGASTTSDPFFERVKEVMKQENIDEGTAWSYVLKNEPELWKQHMYAVINITEEQAARLGIKLVCETTAKFVTPGTHEATIRVLKATAASFGAGGIDSHPLCVQARALAESEKIDFSEAALRVAAKTPALFQSYRESLVRR